MTTSDATIGDRFAQHQARLAGMSFPNALAAGDRAPDFELGNAAGAWVWRSRERAAFATLATLLALPLLWGAWELRDRRAPSGPAVALVQGNVAGEIKWSGQHTAEILHTFIALSDSTASAHPSWVVWPETATGTYIDRKSVV